VAGRFRVAQREGYDVNPVTWHTLARHGIAVRGQEPEHLRIHIDDAELRSWTLGNLNGYWRRWALRIERNAFTSRRGCRGAALPVECWEPELALHDLNRRDRPRKRPGATRWRSSSHLGIP